MGGECTARYGMASRDHGIRVWVVVDAERWRRMTRGSVGHASMMSCSYRTHARRGEPLRRQRVPSRGLSWSCERASSWAL